MANKQPEISEVRSKAKTNKAPRKVRHFSGEALDNGGFSTRIHYEPKPGARKGMMDMGEDNMETAAHGGVDDMLAHLRTRLGAPSAPTAAAGRPQRTAKQTQPAPEPASEMA